MRVQAVTRLAKLPKHPCLLLPHLPRLCLHPLPNHILSHGLLPLRLASSSSSSSSTRWKTRQSRDTYTNSAKLAGLKSRAAYKLLEINHKHHLFRPGDTVVDLGYAPGSWSQVAVNRTHPGGRVVGIDVIPVQPPKGVSTLQGDFLSPRIREEVRKFVREEGKGRGQPRRGNEGEGEELGGRGYVEMGRGVGAEGQEGEDDIEQDSTAPGITTQRERDLVDGRVVNVVLSDMSAPWPLETSTWIKSVSNPYLRMMNTSGMAFRDHAGSMDLCLAALDFSYDTLMTGGHFLCKFYQGSEDHAYEMRLKKLFEKVYRIKPDSSRKESKEAYFLAIRRRPNVAREMVFAGD